MTKVHPLRYATPAAPVCRFGLASATGMTALVCAAVAVWCVLHAHYLMTRLPQATGPVCGTCYAEEMAEAAASQGMPLEQTIPLGVFSGGCSLVAAIQSIRSVNGMRGRLGSRAV